MRKLLCFWIGRCKLREDILILVRLSMQLKLTAEEEKYMSIIEKLKNMDPKQYFWKTKLDSNLEYQRRISHPLDYEKLSSNVVHGKYTTPEEFKFDIIGLYLNGKRFFHTNTHGYRFSKQMIEKADRYLYEEFGLLTQNMRVEDRKQQHREQKSKLFVPDITRWEDFPADIFSEEELYTLMRLALKRLKDEDEWEVFSNPVSRTQYPEYYEVIGKPMDFQTIGQRIKDKIIKNWGDFEEHVEITFANCRHYNDKDSVYYRQAIRLQRVLRRIRKYILKRVAKNDYQNVKELVEEKKKDDVAKRILANYQNTDIRRRRYRIPGFLQKSMKTTVDQLMRNDRNRLFSFPIDTEVVSDYLDLVEKPMALLTIKNNVKDGRYTNYEDFKQDILLVYENSMKYNEKGSKYYEEAEMMYEIAKKKCEQDAANVEYINSLPMNPKDVKSAENSGGRKKRGRSTRNSGLTKPEEEDEDASEDEAELDDQEGGIWKKKPSKFQTLFSDKKEKICRRRFSQELVPLSNQEVNDISQLSMQQLFNTYSNRTINLKKFIEKISLSNSTDEDGISAQIMEVEEDYSKPLLDYVKTEDEKEIVRSILLDLENQQERLEAGFDILDEEIEDEEEDIFFGKEDKEKEEDADYDPNAPIIQKKRGRRKGTSYSAPKRVLEDEDAPDPPEVDEDYVPNQEAPEDEYHPPPDDADYVPDF
jgi:hypothetical protein